MNHATQEALGQLPRISVNNFLKCGSELLLLTKTKAITILLLLLLLLIYNHADIITKLKFGLIVQP